MPVPHASALNGLRVLVVDDNLDFCAWITCVLELYGVEVHATFTVAQGLVAFSQLHPDVVFSDIAMPNEDGYSLLRQIRQLEARQDKSTPVIAITALAEKDAQFQELATRFDQWLVKPIDLDELVDTLTQLTRGATLIPELIFS